MVPARERRAPGGQLKRTLSTRCCTSIPMSTKMYMAGTPVTSTGTCDQKQRGNGAISYLTGHTLRPSEKYRAGRRGCSGCMDLNIQMLPHV